MELLGGLALVADHHSGHALVTDHHSRHAPILRMFFTFGHLELSKIVVRNWER